MSASGNDGVWTYLYRAVDNVGYVSATGTCKVRIDTTKPTVTASAPAGWSRLPVTVSLSPADTGGSGVGTTQYRLAGSGTWLAATGNQFLASGDGVHAYECRALDNAGNASDTGTCVVSIDATAPTTTVAGAPSGWSKTPVALSFTASDAVSGVAGTEYCLNGVWIPGGSCTIVQQGTTTCQYRSSDRAGNVEATKTVSVRIDSQAPTTTARAASAKHNTKVRLRLRVDDGSQSCGSARVTVKIYKGAKLKKTLVLGSQATNALLAYAWKCTLAKGGYTIKVFATDLAGNAQSTVGAARLTVH